MSDTHDRKSDTDNPITASRFFEVITGISQLSAEESKWLDTNMEWRLHVDSVTSIWKEVEAESPERAKVIRHELRRILAHHHGTPSRGAD